MASRPHRWANHNARELETVRGQIESRRGKGLVEGRVLNPNGTVGRSRSDLARAAGGAILSASVGISIQWQGLAEIRQMLERAAKISPQAVSMAINRTIEKARTEVTRALVKQTGLRFGVVRGATSLMRSTPATLTAEIRARGGYTSLREFGARPTKKGVSAAPWGRRQVFDHTFIVKRYGGHVYKREGDARFPIRKLYGPAIPVEMVKGQSKAAFLRAVETELPKRLDHELGRLFGR